jgi:hypothetical protein
MSILTVSNIARGIALKTFIICLLALASFISASAAEVITVTNDLSNTNAISVDNIIEDTTRVNVFFTIPATTTVINSSSIESLPYANLSLYDNRDGAKRTNFIVGPSETNLYKFTIPYIEPGPYTITVKPITRQDVPNEYPLSGTLDGFNDIARIAVNVLSKDAGKVTTQINFYNPVSVSGGAFGVSDTNIVLGISPSSGLVITQTWIFINGLRTQ